MHAYVAAGGTVFNYNSDFSGSVRVQQGETAFVVEIPGEDLIDFIAYCFVVPRRIVKLEEASSESALLLG